MNLVLANIDYSGGVTGSAGHMTNEGHELQEGLRHAGWMLAGHGYGDGCVHVPTLIRRHNPRMVFVQDVRDWDDRSPGCYLKDVAFHNIECLADRSDIFKVCVCKDAGSLVDYQREFVATVRAHAVVTYYHDESTLPLSPWLSNYPRVRTLHSIDNDFSRTIPMNLPRYRGLVSGAIGPLYPLRQLAFVNAAMLGIARLDHPGYGNKGTATRDYLKLLARYKVHVATASAFGFSLRKIIESVAMGCTPVTDLPEYDRLPHIDDALVRVKPGSDQYMLKEAIDRAESEWNEERAMYFAKKAQSFYDYRAAGNRLSIRLTELCDAHSRTDGVRGLCGQAAQGNGKLAARLEQPDGCNQPVRC